MSLRSKAIIRATVFFATCFATLGASPPTLGQEASASFAELRGAALAAMHSTDVTRLEIHASGWEGCLGQPWLISEGWARWELTGYQRVIDYASGTSLQSAQRRAGMDPDKLGGCGAQPDAAPAPQQSSITPATAWGNQLPLWLTPQGFLELASRNDAVAAANADGWTVSFTTSQNGVSYPLQGDFGSDLLLRRIATRLDNSVYGDMLVEAEFSGWRDFNGLLFPASLVHKQGGFAVLDLRVSDVIPNTTASAQPPARQGGAPGGGGGGNAQPALPEGLAEVGPGIYVSHGAYQAVIVAMEEAVVVIDGLQSDARSAQIIAQTRTALPDKPIRYVISTHNHFDHASGLRAFIAEGATVITHKVNEEFFRTALSAPRTLENPDPQDQPVEVLGVGDFFVLSDPSTRIELHHLQGSLHADDMLIAYLPALNAVVEADVLQPWINPVFGGGRDGPHPFLVHLADELERLGLDYTRFIPIHRPPAPPFMTREDLLTAIGREE
jgi:glyoxylase-like metal-dependent hydrolase (beta-lactamase superfamily II)